MKSDSKNYQGDKPLNKAIRWARSLSDEDIAMIIGAELMKASANYPKESQISLQYELAHEIKFRFERFERVPRHNGHYDDPIHDDPETED